MKCSDVVIRLAQRGVPLSSISVVDGKFSRRVVWRFSDDPHISGDEPCRYTRLDLANGYRETFCSPLSDIFPEEFNGVFKATLSILRPGCLIEIGGCES